MSQADPIYNLSDVDFAYGPNFGLSIESLAIDAGERVACIGPSGTGKTTLIRLMTGELLPDRGTVHFDGNAVTTMPDSARRAMRCSQIGLVFQEFELVDYLTARENILLPFHLTRALQLSRAVRDRAEALAEAAGIRHTLSRLPRNLSQGERQRVAICRALVTRPRAILCDEPTGNLDPETSGRVLDLLFSQASDAGAAVFMVTHNHGTLDRFDRVIDVGVLNQWEPKAATVSGAAS